MIGRQPHARESRWRGDVAMTLHCGRVVGICIAALAPLVPGCCLVHRDAGVVWGPIICQAPARWPAAVPLLPSDFESPMSQRGFPPVQPSNEAELSSLVRAHYAWAFPEAWVDMRVEVDEQGNAALWLTGGNYQMNELAWKAHILIDSVAVEPEDSRQKDRVLRTLTKAGVAARRTTKRAELEALLESAERDLKTHGVAICWALQRLWQGADQDRVRVRVFVTVSGDR